MTLKTWAKRVKNDMVVLVLAIQHEGAPWYVKALAAVAIGYALSPIDLIPDFIPILGVLDDLLILPLLITAAMKMMPSEVMEDCKQQVIAGAFTWPAKRWRYGLPILMIWAFILWKFIKIFA